MNQVKALIGRLAAKSWTAAWQLLVLDGHRCLVLGHTEVDEPLVPDGPQLLLHSELAEMNAARVLLVDVL